MTPDGAIVTGGILHLTYQYTTDSGAKLPAKSGNAVQEIFIVCEPPEVVKQFLERVGNL